MFCLAWRSCVVSCVENLCRAFGGEFPRFTITQVKHGLLGMFRYFSELDLQHGCLAIIAGAILAINYSNNKKTKPNEKSSSISASG